MSNHTPYLQRRGDTFSFRIAIPAALHGAIGKREFIKSLQTTDKRIAVVKALKLAATAKHYFNQLNIGMSEQKNEKLMQLLKETKHRLALEIQGEDYERELSELRCKHEEELKQAKLEAENNAFKHALASSRASGGAYSSLKLAKLTRSDGKAIIRD